MFKFSYNSKILIVVYEWVTRFEAKPYIYKQKKTSCLCPNSGYAGLQGQRPLFVRLEYDL